MTRTSKIDKTTKLRIIKMYYNQGLSLRQISDTLGGYYGDIITKSTIHRILQEFNEETPKEVRPPPQQARAVRTEEVIIGAFYADSHQSSRIVGKNVGYSQTRVLQVLKKYNFKPYKLHTHQELQERDFETRNNFCEVMFQKATENNNFIKNICFTDESTFFLHTKPNKQNHRVWSCVNPRQVISTRTQYPKKVNIWAGILNHNIIGPFVIEGNLNGEKYLRLLRDQVIPQIREIANINQVWYQHDGCPSHFVRPVTRLLDETFPNRWIGRGGPIHWPPRSPDMAPNDFFLWPYLGNKVFTASSKYNSIEEVQNAILLKANNIDARILANVRQEFYDRLSHCLIQNGGLFEHLLK